MGAGTPGPMMSPPPADMGYNMSMNGAQYNSQGQVSGRRARRRKSAGSRRNAAAGQVWEMSGIIAAFRRLQGFLGHGFPRIAARRVSGSQRSMLAC